MFDDVPSLSIEGGEQNIEEEEDEISIESEEEEGDNIEKKSIFNEISLNGVNLNFRKEVKHTVTILNEQPIINKNIINFKHNKNLVDFFARYGENINSEKYKNYNESNCFICNWANIIKIKKEKNGKKITKIKTYPDIDDKPYSEFMTLVEMCKEDFVITNEALNYYMVNIQIPNNMSIEEYNKSNKIKFPSLTRYKIYFHATEKKNIKNKMEYMCNTYLDLSNYIKEEIGLVILNPETNKGEINNKALNDFIRCNNEASKLQSVLQFQPKNKYKKI